jgi:hypothetical protein
VLVRAGSADAELLRAGPQELRLPLVIHRKSIGPADHGNIIGGRGIAAAAPDALNMINTEFTVIS